MKNRIKVLFIQLMVFFFLLEIALTILSEASIINIGKPSYSIAKQDEYYYTTGKTGGGVWRRANAEYRFSNGCFNVLYSTNSHGTRDSERQLSSSNKRVIVLGDSFAEGYGVEKGDRFSDILEANNNIEFLNFGLSGVGLTQEVLIYKDHASGFSHDAVLLMLFPSNDVYDDNPELSHYYTNGFKPYLEGDYPEYSVVWKGNDKEGEKKKGESLLKRLIKNFSYSVKLYQYLKGRWELQSLMKDNEGLDRPFFEMAEDEWSRIKYLIGELKAMMGQRELFVATIPDVHASLRLLNSEDRVTLRDSLVKLSHELDFKYHDLLSELTPATAEGWFDLYFDCDEHWNARGNSWAADKLDSAFRFKELLLDE